MLGVWEFGEAGTLDISEISFWVLPGCGYLFVGSHISAALREIPLLFSSLPFLFLSLYLSFCLSFLQGLMPRCSGWSALV